jgi:hypothetical protein
MSYDLRNIGSGKFGFLNTSLFVCLSSSPGFSLITASTIGRRSNCNN